MLIAGSIHREVVVAEYSEVQFSIATFVWRTDRFFSVFFFSMIAGWSTNQKIPIDNWSSNHFRRRKLVIEAEPTTRTLLVRPSSEHGSTRLNRVSRDWCPKGLASVDVVTCYSSIPTNS